MPSAKRQRVELVKRLWREYQATHESAAPFADQQRGFRIMESVPDREIHDWFAKLELGFGRFEGPSVEYTARHLDEINTAHRAMLHENEGDFAPAPVLKSMMQSMRGSRRKRRLSADERQRLLASHAAAAGVEVDRDQLIRK